MQPWGFLESATFDVERLDGPPPAPARLRSALEALSTALEGTEYVSIESASSDEQPFFIASTKDGRHQRLDARGRPAPLGARDWAKRADRLGSAPPVLLGDGGDGYLFDHRDPTATRPSYRFSLPGPGEHALYFDAATGLFEADFDANARSYRWIEGLHRMDWLRALRRRPLWDALVLCLLSGVTAVCATGAWLGYRSLFVRKR